MNGHLATFAIVQFVAEQLVHEFVDGEAAIDQGTLFPILRHDHVAIIQRCGTADHGGFLAGALHVETQAPLALGGEHAFIENPGGDHRTINAQGLFFIQIECFGALIKGAVLLQ